MKHLATTLAAAIAGSLASSATAWAQGGERYYYGHGYMMDGAWGWFGGLMMMVLMIALIAVAVALTLRFLGQGQGPRTGRAMDILNERFARGEIDKTEFEERQQALQNGQNR